MTFSRRSADIWQRDIPGARWFKADLHVHTIDDHPGGRALLPEALSGDPWDADVIRCYARLFLRAAIENGVQILGLTPHSPRTGTTPQSSAVWAIVEEWNTGNDDGTPWRERIFAVFPGFEPNINVGSKGVHVLLLFDPEIGRDRYLSLYDAVMDGREPWKHSALQATPRNADDVFNLLDRRKSESVQSAPEWHYIALAPHFQGDHGVIREIGSQVLQRFPCNRLCGYELGDEKLQSDIVRGKKPGRFLLPFMEDHRQAFFHASDAYSIDELGRRHTWLKLGTPRIEALRQAFIASESRMRAGFERNNGGSLQIIGDAPDVGVSKRPWLKRASVTGAGSFFGGGNKGSSFPLSPDLTCIIGGSMTGKSTLLDGLRVHIRAGMPKDGSTRQQVETRGSQVFAAGSAKIKLDCPGADRTAPPIERWPALFFAQNELQRLSQETSAVADILARLVPSETLGIQRRNANLRDLDDRLRHTAKELSELDDTLAEAEQAVDRATAAKNELEAFTEVGVDKLQAAARDHQRWKDATESAEAVLSDIRRATSGVRSIDIPKLEARTTDDSASELAEIEQRRAQLDKQFGIIELEWTNWTREVARIAESMADRQREVHVAVERALAGRGLDPAKLREVQEINRQASLLPSYQAHRDQKRESMDAAEQVFDRAQAERRKVVEQQREAFDRVISEVERVFGGRIHVRRIDNGDHTPLEDFLLNLKQRGISRWWNDLEVENRPSPQELTERLGHEPPPSEADAGKGSQSARAGSFDNLGMSDVVQATFRETMTRARRRELSALRCPDRYFLELRMDDGSYRRLDELSGGQRVSVLLSLLLETEDERPLVIDQPEDELDNRFLFETVLPALKRLKGRRQVIVATHNANIVVNGDADMVIQLEATANRGRVALVGAIEEPKVRDAIVRTVDGGEDAFRLRRRKYGF